MEGIFLNKVTPFEFVTFWDLFIVTIGIVFRMVFSINKKYKQLGEKFIIKKYFDFLHVIRWALHMVTAYSMILVLPQFFISYIGPKYLDGFDTWTYLGSGLIGFLGYDIIKVFEQVFSMALKKINVDVNKLKNEV